MSNPFIPELWHKQIWDALATDVKMASGVNDMLEGLCPTRSHLTVRRGRVSFAPIRTRDFSTWRRFSQGYQIPRDSLSSRYVDLQLICPPRQDVEARKWDSLPGASLNTPPYITAELIRKSKRYLEQNGHSTDKVLGLQESEYQKILDAD